MAKILSIFGMAVSILLLLVFGLDLAIGFPFNGYNSMMSIGFVVFSALLVYLSWSAIRELR
ncbi:MAG: hypothetical protein NTW96_01680 [Planctomycetia bacterium]|jgi:hypothetical protein|nr:hypothetical protein [Planctomycetia bacterium]